MQIASLNGFDTRTSTTQPDAGANPRARSAARKWRYSMAGEGTGWNFTTAEKNQWSVMGNAMGGSEMVSFGGFAQIAVADVAGSATLSQVTVTITIRQGLTTQLVTMVSRP